MGVSSHNVIDGAAVFATSVPMLALRLFGSVALLLAVGYAAVSVARRRAPSGRGKARPITVRGRLGLTRRSSLVLISVGERNLLIGVTDSAVNVVAEGNDLHVEVPDSLDTPSSFGDALSVALRDRFGGSSQ
jgi:flagellar biogenesis protein FliO